MGWGPIFSSQISHYKWLQMIGPMVPKPDAIKPIEDQCY